MILIVDPDSSFRSRLAGALGRPGLQQADGLDELKTAASAAGAALRVVILGPNLIPSEALAETDALGFDAQGISVLMITETVTPEVLRAALRSGVNDVLPVSLTGDELEEAVRRAESMARPAPESGHRRRVVTVFSLKGGCGKSVVASNLAVLLAQRTGAGVGLVDLDLGSGDLAIMLGLTPGWTIYDAAENLDRLDAQALIGYLTPHSSNVKLLPAPLDPTLAEAVSADAVRQILQILGETLEYVVVDAPSSFTDQILAALDQSDLCVLMGSMDVPSIRNLKLALGTLAALGFERERIKVVLSRADSRVGLHLAEVEKTLGTKIDATIPSSREVTISVNQGVPLALQSKKSPVVTALGGIVDALIPPANPRLSTRRGPKGLRPTQLRPKE